MYNNKGMWSANASRQVYRSAYAYEVRCHLTICFSYRKGSLSWTWLCIVEERGPVHIVITGRVVTIHVRWASIATIVDIAQTDNTKKTDRREFYLRS